MCCPEIGSVANAPVAKPIQAQCSGRRANDAVYCTCRCDAPNDLDIDRAQLCSCPDGYACVDVCSQSGGACELLPKGKLGSYCVKVGSGTQVNSPEQAAAACGAPLRP